MYALPFLLQATHVDQRLRVCRIILVNAFPSIIEYLFCRNHAGFAMVFQAPCIRRNKEGFDVFVVLSHPGFIVYYYLLCLCFVCNHDALFGQIICSGALNDIERIFAYEHVRSHVLYRSFNRYAYPCIYFKFLLCLNTRFLSDALSFCGIRFA